MKYRIIFVVLVLVMLLVGCTRPLYVGKVMGIAPNSYFVVDTPSTKSAIFQIDANGIDLAMGDCVIYAYGYGMAYAQAKTVCP